MKKFNESYFCTFVLFLIGLLLFAVVFPEYPYMRTSAVIIYTTVFFAFSFIHFFWLFRKRNKKRLIWLIGGPLVTLLLINGIILGKQSDQRKIATRTSRTALIKLALLNYHQEQCDYWFKNNKFDEKLHKKFEAKGMKLSTVNEDSMLIDNCSDCIVSEKNFKVAGISIYEGEILFVILDGMSCSGEFNFIVNWYPVKH